MGTLTSRLKLLKPDRLELVKVLEHLNANLDRLDAGGNGAYVCTSTTRPNGNNYPLFNGMLIFESDTGYFFARSGNTWERVAHTWGGGSTFFAGDVIIDSPGQSRVYQVETDQNAYFRIKRSSDGKYVGQVMLASNGNVDIYAGGNTSTDNATRIQLLPNGDINRFNYPDTTGKPIMFASQSGEVSVNGSNIAAGGFQEYNINLASGRFSAVPNFFFTLRGSVAGAGTIVPRLGASSTSSFTMRLTNTGTAAVSFTGQSVQWLAVQMRPGSSDG